MQLRNGFQAQRECTSEHEQEKQEKKKKNIKHGDALSCWGVALCRSAAST
jgi:hypothetical protein